MFPVSQIRLIRLISKGVIKGKNFKKPDYKQSKYRGLPYYANGLSLYQHLMLMPER